MEELVIRPSMKFIKMGYLAVIVLIVAGAIAQNHWQESLPPELPSWVIPAALALLLLSPISRHIRQRFTKMTMLGDKLRYGDRHAFESRRTIQLSKVQDWVTGVTWYILVSTDGGRGRPLDRSKRQGETSRLTFPNIDSPQAVADRIIDESHRIGVRGIVDDGEKSRLGRSSPGHRGEQRFGKGDGAVARGSGREAGSSFAHGR